MSAEFSATYPPQAPRGAKSNFIYQLREDYYQAPAIFYKEIYTSLGIDRTIPTKSTAADAGLTPEGATAN